MEEKDQEQVKLGNTKSHEPEQMVHSFSYEENFLILNNLESFLIAMYCSYENC